MFDEISFSILFAAVGIILMVLGWIRPVGMTLYCRRCSYNLTANSSGICPECGSEVSAETTHFGVRKTNRIIFGCGFIICILGLPWTADGLRFVSDQDWYEYYPTFVILNDLDEDDSRKRAMAEIRRRISNEQLNDRQTNAAAKQLVALCDPARANQIEVGIVLDAHFACEQLAQREELPAEELRTWLRQMETPKIHWWPADQRWAFESILSRDIPHTTSGLCRLYRVEIVDIDGQLLREPMYEAMVSGTDRLLTWRLKLPDHLNHADTATIGVSVTTYQGKHAIAKHGSWPHMDGSVIHATKRNHEVLANYKRQMIQDGVELDHYAVTMEVSLQHGVARYEIDPMREQAERIVGRDTSFVLSEGRSLTPDRDAFRSMFAPGSMPICGGVRIMR